MNIVSIFIILCIIIFFVAIIIAITVVIIFYSLSQVSIAPDISNGFTSVFVSFAAGDVHLKNQELQKQKNIQYNETTFHDTVYHNPKTLPAAYFDSLCQELKSSTRGFHYWSWKPWIILEMMNQTPLNTVIVYLDAGAYFKRDIHPLISQVYARNRIFFNNKHTNNQYCSCEPMSKLLLDTNHKFSNTLQIDASCVLLLNTLDNKLFVRDWLKACLNYNYISDYISTTCDNVSDFIEHRHDQSLLSIIAKNNHIGQSFFSPLTKMFYINHHRNRQ